jgi:hypothetical protein
MFLILGAQKQFTFKKISTTHQLKFGKNRNPWYNIWKMTIARGEICVSPMMFGAKNVIL